LTRILAAFALLPVATFAAGYAYVALPATAASSPRHSSASRPRCAPGHVPALDGANCADWQVVPFDLPRPPSVAAHSGHAGPE
jgi:hypothetical protein